jgi:cyclohexanecarboxyl-CoA dehydrogenase
MFHDMGNIPAGRASLMFNEVQVPVAFRIGAEGEGFSKVMRAFDASRVLVGLAALALAETSLTETVEYVKTKTAFGSPLSRFEAISFKLAEHATLLEAARMICYKALKLRDEGLPHSKEAAMAKWFAPKCAVNALHDLMLISGHRGYSEENPIEQRWRDAISALIGDGTAEIMKLIIAREILGGKFGPTM